MYDVITIGDTMQDVFLVMTKENAHVFCEHKPEECQLCFNYQEKIPVLEKHQNVGGNAANTAVAFARLGMNTAIYTHVGADDTGEMIENQLKKNKVETQFIKIDHKIESNYNTIINIHGERTILTFHQHRDYELPEISPARWLYFTSLSQGFECLIKPVIDYIVQYKVNLVIQPGTFQIKAGAGSIKPLLQHCKILFLNKEEAQSFCEKDSNDVNELLKAMRGLGAEIAVLTDGSRGAYCFDGKQTCHIEPPPDMEKVDTTGAGDAFASGFTAAMADGLDYCTALTWGQAEAGSVIATIGAQNGLLSHNQLDEIIKNNPYKIVIT